MYYVNYWHAGCNVSYQISDTERDVAMMNYIYGSVMTVTVVTMLDIIDTNIPNGLAFYFDQMLPF